MPIHFRFSSVVIFLRWSSLRGTIIRKSALIPGGSSSPPPGLTFEFQSFSLHPTALQLVASDFKAAKNLVFGPLIETKNNKKQPLQRPCPLSESNRGSSHNARLLRVLKWIRPCFLIERITILTDAVPLSHCYLLVWCEKYAQKVHSQRAILWMQKFYLYYILLFLL